jgi:hypothetical protein
MLFLLIPVALVVAVVLYRSEFASSTTHAAQLRPMSAADGKVHVESPISELDVDMWDGVVTWHAYPNAASYDVLLYRDPGKILWQESSTNDQIALKTEAFPYALRHLINTSVTMSYKVIAKDRSGNVIADSGPQYFYLRVLPQVGFIY